MTLRKLLSEIEFDYKIADSEDGRKEIRLTDETGVNLGKIESETFLDAAAVIDRTEQYWKDYVIDDAKERLGMEENATWDDVYKAAFLKDDPAADVLRSLAHPEIVEIEDLKSVENTMNHDETLIFEDLTALSNEEDSALPKFSRVKIYNPGDYGLLPDGDKIHVLAEYNGNEPEDSVFNQLNDRDLPSEFNGREIDWNPISTALSGTIEHYLEHLLKTQEQFEKEKESLDIHKTIKETAEQTVNEKLGRTVESAEDFMETYNRLLAAENSVFNDMPLQVAEAVMDALNVRSIKLFEKDGKFVTRETSNMNQEFTLAPDDVVEHADDIISDWIINGNSERLDEENLGRLKWYENGMRFPDEERVNGISTSYAQCFDLLKSHFPEITKEESELIFDAMENQNYVVYAGKYGVFVEDYTDINGMELNQVDLPTLAEYALGDASLSKEQQDILWNLVPNVNHKNIEEKNMEENKKGKVKKGTIKLNEETKEFYKNAMDATTADRMSSLADKAYAAYQLEWLKDRGISLTDIADSMDDVMNADADGKPTEDRLTAYGALNEVISNGIGGEMFASFEEFRDNEILDKEIVKNLLSNEDYKEYAGYLPELTGENSVSQTVDVRRQDANDYINEMNPVASGSVRNALESLKATPLDVYFSVGEDARMNAYLVSRTESGSYTTHLINKNGLNWGHYDIGTKWAAQKQAMTRAAGTDFDDINLIEVESLKEKKPEISRDEVIAQVTWTRQDIVNAIENEKGSGYEVTDKDIDSALDELSPKYMEEKMTETGWDFINEAVENSLSHSNEIPLHDIYVADKERKVAVSFRPEYVFNEKTGENDLPNVGITVENTISGRRNSMDKVIPTPYLSEFQSGDGGFFVRDIAAKEGITSEKIESISADDFQKIRERTESIAPLEKQTPVEKLLRQTQAVLFRKGIGSISANTDEIFKAAKGVLDTFSKEEKNEAKKFFKNFGDIEKTKAANEVTALAHFIASSDADEVLKKYPSLQKKNGRKAEKETRERD